MISAGSRVRFTYAGRLVIGFVVKLHGEPWERWAEVRAGGWTYGVEIGRLDLT